MKNLVKFYNENPLENSENLYLYFSLGQCKYAIGIQQVVEIMKLPLLDYPQKLPNNVIGLLNYNNFTINILDLRFYLDIKVTPYSVSNQLLIVKTDETIFGLLIDKVDDIIPLNETNIEYFNFPNEKKIIEFLYKTENETISVINISALEETIKQGVPSLDIDIPSLFPNDDDSRYKLMRRHQSIAETSQMNFVTNLFSQDKFISFSLDDNTYCLNLEYVKEFLKNSAITKIPCNLAYIAGVITLRGDFITIIDLKKFLNISDDNPHMGRSSKNNIIIIETADFQIGFLVDEIFRIIDIPEELVEENVRDHQPDKNILCEVVIDEKVHTILNLPHILSDERFYIEDNV